MYSSFFVSIFTLLEDNVTAGRLKYILWSRDVMFRSFKIQGVRFRIVLSFSSHGINEPFNTKSWVTDVVDNVFL